MTPRHFTWQAWRLMTSSDTLRGRCGAWSHPAALCVAGLSHPLAFCVAGAGLMALGWLWWRTWGWDWSPVTPRHFGVAGLALGDIQRHFAWQAWQLVTSTFVLHGRRGTYGTGLALVARLGWDWSPVTPRHFAWQAWHLWHWAGSGGALGLGLVAGDVTTLCVAGVALVIQRHFACCFAWQAWHLVALGWLWWRAWAGIGRR